MKESEVVAAITRNHTLVMTLIDTLMAHPHFVQMMKERFAEATQSPQNSQYVRDAGRSINSLSEQQIQQYLDGDGMGLARPAELNGYPGPRHVLDLSRELRLGEKTRQQISKAFERMHTEAARLGKRIVEGEKRLDERFRTGAIDSTTLTHGVLELGRLKSALRTVHLRAHLTTASLLTADQIELYRQLRGYDQNASHHDHHH